MASVSAAQLLSQILADRRDDELRLAYADTLGADPRAEFIRVQLALAGVILRVGKSFHSRARERELLRAHQRAWRAPVAPYVESCFFRRGFVEYIVLGTDGFLAGGAAMLASEPILDLCLRPGRGSLRELLDSPLLLGMRSLSLVGHGLDDDDARALAECPHLTELRWLDLRANQLGEAGFEALAASSRLRELRWLDLGANVAADPTPQQMAEGEYVHGEALTPFGEALRARYPGLRWMEGPAAIAPDPWRF